MPAETRERTENSVAYPPWSWEPSIPGIRPHWKSIVANVKIFPPDQDGAFYKTWYVVADDDYEREFHDGTIALKSARLLCENKS